jgi:hypothetical protein
MAFFKHFLPSTQSKKRLGRGRESYDSGGPSTCKVISAYMADKNETVQFEKELFRDSHSLCKLICAFGRLKVSLGLGREYDFAKRIWT